MALHGRKVFPSQYRMRRHADFDRMWVHGQRCHTPHFIVIVLKKSDGSTRLGLTVSRKVGGAVLRNRLKRLVREFFRNHYFQLPQYIDLSIIAKKDAAKLNYSGICDELGSLFNLN